MADRMEIKMELDKPAGKLRDDWEQLTPRVREKALKQAATAGGTVYVRAIRREVPVESGLTKKAINKRVKLFKNSETAVAVAGASTAVSGEYRGRFRKPSKYIALINSGVKAHAEKRGNVVFQHPGFAGKHFMEHAAQGAEGAALAATENKLVEVIEREIAKVGK